MTVVEKRKAMDRKRRKGAGGDSLVTDAPCLADAVSLPAVFSL